MSGKSAERTDMKKIIVFSLTLLLCFSLLISCSSGMTEEELKNTVGDLLEKSVTVNEIYFGTGLPHAPATGIADNAQDYDEPPAEYCDVVSVNYKSVDDLKAAALEVYTESYCDSIFEMTFLGMQNDDGTIFRYARFIDSFEGTLQIRADAADDAITLGREYDLSTLKILREGSDYVYFTLDSSLDGKNETVQLCIKKGDSGWRFDTPTY